jgi:mannose-6-phosphate isomerase-like protein (cupin superfamily)
LSIATDRRHGAVAKHRAAGDAARVTVRRVVTGRDAAGRSVFVLDEAVEPLVLDLLPGWEFHALWGADAAAGMPSDGREPPWHSYFPPPGGVRFAFSTIPPETTPPPSGVDAAAAEAEVERALPGMLAAMEPDAPGMHTTDTVDFEVILSGEVVLELDDGEERRLGPGEVVVQNGTRHRWRNPGREPAVMAVFMLGAERSP